MKLGRGFGMNVTLNSLRLLGERADDRTPCDTHTTRRVIDLSIVVSILFLMLRSGLDVVHSSSRGAERTV